MTDRILILGASARAAAASARRAGLVPFAVDLFADRDTQLICERVERCPPAEYPHGLFERAKAFPPMPWMYTGGLENYPTLVDELSRERELWGNGQDVLEQVRNPASLSSRPHHPDFEYPPVVLPGGTTRPAWAASRRWRWVRKPLQGSGGLGVRFATEEDQQRIADPGCRFFLQAFCEGRPGSVVFRNSRPIGFTRQLVGTEWLHAAPFAYAGSVTWLCSRRAFIDIARTFRMLRGLWGTDLAVVPGSGCYLLEVNPRYPASTEVIELATGISALDSSRTIRSPASLHVGKAIYYAPHRLTFPAAGPWDDSLARAADVWHRPDFADIPHPGDTIEPGHPVLTVLTDADTESDCLARLQLRATELDRLFGVRPPTQESPP